MAKTPLRILTPERELTERIDTINPTNLPPIKGLVLQGKAVEMCSREELIKALYTMAGIVEKMKMEAGL